MQKYKKCKLYWIFRKQKIIELLKKMHIFTHPSIWPETSCIAAIESMAAGCEVVITNLGALYETCSPFGTFVNFDRNFNNLEKRFSKILTNSIKNYWTDENQNKLKLQRESINALIHGVVDLLSGKTSLMKQEE
jgi:glycosyltransferase involved in cell wall biosynthesis